MEPELVADYECRVGEGPIWHPMEKQIYWLDIPRGLVFRFNPATNEHGVCYEGDPVGGLTIQADGTVLFFMSRGAVAIWREGKLEYVIDEIPKERDGRFNDVITDPAGRVFCGAMPTKEHPGTLYLLDTDGSIKPVLEEVGLPNGMGFTPDRKQMYFTDSHIDVRRIYRFDYDQESGNLSNRVIFLEVPPGQGVADGMTVDAEGYVWSARWGGGVLVRYTPQGVEERRIKFPTQKVTCATFGGEDYSDIYVTTAGGYNRPEEGPGAGALFRLKLGIRGVPEFFSRIRL